MATGTDRDNPDKLWSPSIWRRFLTRLGFRSTDATPNDTGLVPASFYDAGGGSATKFLREDGSWETPASAGGGITQLEGDVTTGTGGGLQAATIATDAVETSMIADANVTYAKLQNVSASSRILGSSQTGSGAAPVEISLSGDFTMTGTTLAVPQVGANLVRIGVNEGDIATNASNISTNTSNISTNTSNISTNTSNISTNATDIAKRIMRCSMHVDANSNVLIQTTVDQFLANNNRNIQLVDLSAYTQVRLSHRTVTRNVADGSRLVVRYVTTYSQTASDYIDMGTGGTPSEVTSSLGAWNLQTSGWQTLNENAQVDTVYLAVLQNSGDGGTARASNITVEFK